MALGQPAKTDQFDLFKPKTGGMSQKEADMNKKKYGNPFHSDEEMCRLDIDDAVELEGEDRKMLLIMVTGVQEVSIQIIFDIARAILKKRGIEKSTDKEQAELVRSIVKTISNGWKFRSSVFQLLKKRAGSARDAFAEASETKPKFGIEKSLPIGDRDEENK